MTPHKGYVDASGGQIHYAELGEGPPLLLMGETPRSFRLFDRLQPLLAPHVRAIAVDLPGLGNSHALPEPVSVPAVAACLGELLDGLRLERAHVFGMHTGNKVAAAFAADSPGRVDKLVIAGQTHSLFPETEKRNAALAPSFKRYHGQERDDAGRPLRAWLGAKLTLDGTWWPETVVSGATQDPQAIATAEAKVVDYLLGWRSAVPIYHAVFDHDLAEAVGRIEAETLVLEYTTPEEEHYGAQGPRLAALMKRATARSIPVTYLAAMEQQPDRIADAVLAFLGGQHG